MKRTLILLCVALSALATAQTKGNPGSLFDPKVRNPFTDNVARTVGDILTVIVDEKTIANFSASTQATKNDSNSVNAKFFVGLLDSLFRPVTTAVSAAMDRPRRTAA